MTTVVDEMFRHFRISAVEYAIAQLPEVARAYHPSSYRWMLFHQFLSQLPAGRFTNVMFVDTRDTVFQRDPFSFLSGPGFYAFVEAGPKRIASCTWNRGWVADCFGDDVLRDVGTKPISCSGTSMASWEHAVLYARLMAAEIEGNACERNGVDQGSPAWTRVAFCLWSSMRRRRRVVQACTTCLCTKVGSRTCTLLQTRMAGLLRCRTCGSCGGERPCNCTASPVWRWCVTQRLLVLCSNMFGEVLNDNDEVVAVVHQYDRSPQLLSQYRDHFRLIDDADLMKK
jgi:hypothetical protein